jgi:hypothetical protein
MRRDVALPFAVRRLVPRGVGGAYALGPSGELARVDGRGRLSGLFQTALRSLAAPPVTEPVRAWHAGSVAAPELAPELGSSVTDAGRPMSKPRFTPTQPDARSVPTGEAP